MQRGYGVTYGAVVEEYEIPGLDLDDLVPDAVLDNVGHILGAELFHDGSPVGFRGFQADMKARSRFLCGKALSQKLAKLGFPG